MSGVDPFHAERGTDAVYARVLAETGPGGKAAMAAASTLELEGCQIAIADNDRILLERQEEEEVSHHSWGQGAERGRHSNLYL